MMDLITLCYHRNHMLATWTFTFLNIIHQSFHSDIKYWEAWVVQSVQCLTTDWMTGVQSPTEAKNFSSSLCIQTSSEAHPSSHPMGTRGPFPKGKAWPRHDTDHSPSSSTKVENE
jgi:hypothetical protein